MLIAMFRLKNWVISASQYKLKDIIKAVFILCSNFKEKTLLYWKFCSYDKIARCLLLKCKKWVSLMPYDCASKLSKW